MNNIQEYRVIAHTEQQAHTDLVNAAIKEGWQPQGGIGITAFINSIQQETMFFAQSVVKWIDDADEKPAEKSAGAKKK